MNPKEHLRIAEETLQKEFPTLSKDDRNTALCLVAYISTAVITVEQIPERMMIAVLGSGLINRLSSWKFTDEKQRSLFLDAVNRAQKLLYSKPTPEAPPLSAYLNQFKETK